MLVGKFADVASATLLGLLVLALCQGTVLGGPSNSQHSQPHSAVAATEDPATQLMACIDVFSVEIGVNNDTDIIQALIDGSYHHPELICSATLNLAQCAADVAADLTLNKTTSVAYGLLVTAQSMISIAKSRNICVFDDLDFWSLFFQDGDDVAASLVPYNQTDSRFQISFCSFSTTSSPGPSDPVWHLEILSGIANKPYAGVTGKLENCINDNEDLNATVTCKTKFRVSPCLGMFCGFDPNAVACKRTYEDNTGDSLADLASGLAPPATRRRRNTDDLWFGDAARARRQPTAAPATTSAPPGESTSSQLSAAANLVRIFTDESLGDNTTQQVDLLADDDTIRFTYTVNEDVTAPALSLSIKLVAGIFAGTSSTSDIIDSLRSTFAATRTRIYMRCDPNVYALPKLEPIQSPKTVGILTSVDFEIRHRCACSGAENCTLESPSKGYVLYLECLDDAHVAGKAADPFETWAWAIPVSAILILILFLIEERQPNNKATCFGGMLIPYPFSYLDSRSNTIILVLMFSALNIQIINTVVINGAQLVPDSVSPYATSLVQLALSLVFAFILFPAFVATTTRYRLVGSIVGLIVVLSNLSTEAFMLSCTRYWTDPFEIALLSPTTVFLSISALYFVALGAEFIYSKMTGAPRRVPIQRESGRSKALKHFAIYEEDIRELLRPPRHVHAHELTSFSSKTSKTSDPTLGDGTWARLQRWTSSAAEGVKRGVLAVRKRTYRASPRLQLITVISIVLITTVYVGSMFVLDKARVYGKKFILYNGQDEQCEALDGYVLFKPAMIPLSYLDLKLGCSMINRVADAMFGSLMAAVTLSTAIQYFLVYMSFKLHRTRLNQLARGDRRWLPISLPDNSSALTYAAKFVAYQSAALFVGWVIFSAILGIGAVIIVFLIVYPAMGLYPDFFSKWFFKQVVLFAIPIAVAYAQKYFVRYFVQSRDGSLGLRDRRLYFNMEYFLFVFNLTSGLLAFLSRWLTSFAFAVLFVARLDFTSFPQGWSSYDSGYSTYIGFLLTDAYYSNRVLVTFVRLLIEPRKNYSGDIKYKSMASAFARRRKVASELEEQLVPAMSDYVDTDETGMLSAQRARTRWFLAYTLIKNPKLVHERRHGLLVENSMFYSTRDARRGDDELISPPTAPETSASGTVAEQMSEHHVSASEAQSRHHDESADTDV